MLQSLKALFIALVLAAVLTGCASVTPPPDRIYWDEAPASTQCTDSRGGTVGQYALSLIASALGGFDLGAGIATGYIPVVGIGLTTIGLWGAYDSGEKFESIERCREFKEYVAMREARSSQGPSVTEGAPRARLGRLEALYEDGEISEDEYRAARQRILEDL